MTSEIEILVRYRMDRALESLEEAKILIEKKHSNTFVNRLYYACFYAVTAFLLSKGLSSSKHSGVRALFHREIIKSGILNFDQGKLYDKLFDTRQKADYADLLRFDPEEVRPWLLDASEFVGKLKELLSLS